MKQEYIKPELEELGRVRDVTAQTGSPVVVDVPQGTPVGLGPIVGSH